MIVPAIFVFPPNGNKYKFPKRLPNCFDLENVTTFQNWLIDNGYPEQEARTISITEPEYHIKLVGK